MKSKDYREGFYTAKAIAIEVISGWAQATAPEIIDLPPLKQIIGILESIELSERSDPTDKEAK